MKVDYRILRDILAGLEYQQDYLKSLRMDGSTLSVLALSAAEEKLAKTIRDLRGILNPPPLDMTYDLG